MSAKVMEARVLAGLRAWHGDAELKWEDFDGDGADHRKMMQLAIEAADKARGGEAVCNVDGSWLWLKLMDWCKSQGIAPGTQDALFRIATEAHQLYTHPADGVDLPEASESDKKIGWKLDYKFIESLADAVIAAGYDATMEAIEAALLAAREIQHSKGRSDG